MIEPAILASIFYYIYKSKPGLEERLKSLVSKSDPSIAEKLDIESTTQLNDLMKSMKYIPDTGDYTMSPEETIKLGGGDCEDLAVLSYSILEYLGLNPGIAIAFSPDDPEAHAFTFFYCTRCSEYYIYSNNTVFKSPSIKEAANMLGYDYVIYTEIEQPEEVVSLQTI
jgi:hypothetical protein